MALDKKLQMLQQHFDSLAQRTDSDGIEFWFARDLQPHLGYARWENFQTAIIRSVEACRLSGFKELDHFRGVTKMVLLGSGAERAVEDLILTRYACYLIAQNGDPRKPEIAFAQSYFAVQTRKQELIEDRMRLYARLEARDRLKESEKALSQNIYERGIDDAGFSRIRSRGDAALFGGHTTQDMKDRYGIVKNRPLADFLPTLTIAAKNLATEMTNYNVQQIDLHGEQPITSEHEQNNVSVRDMLGLRHIKPEELPAEEDLKKLQRRVKAQDKKLGSKGRQTPITKK
ncbi:DNA damage-inducible protein D [Obesumbacterium proteus]|nr:DNA damage-inducible protein D [Obesumbacterium proteus]